MHMNIWLNDKLMKGVEIIMKDEGKKRNTVIADAVTHYLNHKKPDQWPDEIKNFTGIKGLEDWEGFEAGRKNLKEPKENIFGDKE